MPTFLTGIFPIQSSYYVLGGDNVSQILFYANNWLREGAFNLRFLAYRSPQSVETPTLDKRRFYGSHPPGAYIPIYWLLKALDVTGIIPNIYHKRGTQLLLLIYYNFMLHFMLVLLLGVVVFFVCRKIGFDNLNSTLLALVPSIVQFHNPASLYYHHFEFDQTIAVMLPFVTCVFLEFFRISYASSRIRHIVKVLQPLVIFYGLLTSWFLIFVVLTLYAIRVIRREINLPLSFPRSILWLKQSFLFFAPSLAAIACFAFTIIYYLRSIAKTNLSNASISSRGFTLIENILYRIGLGDGLDRTLLYWKMSFVIFPYVSYGLAGLVMIYSIFYFAIRVRSFVPNEVRRNNPAIILCLMLFIPCLIKFLVFAQENADHPYMSILLSPILSVGFAFAPIFVLQMLKKNHLTSVLKLKGNCSVTAAALLALVAGTLYGYDHIYDRRSVTKFFSAPAYHHVAMGNFIKRNTAYEDVVFSNSYYLKSGWDISETYFTDKSIYFASNISHVYYKTKSIEQDFSIKVFFSTAKRSEAESLSTFLREQGITVSSTEEDRVGNLLAFDGKEFISWYEQVHECDVYPRRCNAGE